MLERPADVMRQYIDAVATFEACEDARAEAANVRGGMYWHKGPASAPHKAYLVRTSASGREKSLGPRSPETESIYTEFRRRKEWAEQRLAGLNAALAKHKRMNRALRVGRVAPFIVEILNRLAASDMGDHFRVVGTHALYAYESAAGVTFKEDAAAMRDFDLLGDVRNRVAFATALDYLDSSMLSILRKVDPTFRIRNSQRYAAVNEDGFEVDVIRHERVADDSYPVRPSANEKKLYAAQALPAQELLDWPQFSAVIVATNGDMARMNTVEPMEFIHFKQRMSTQPDRDPLKRRRDALQANAVEDVLRDYLPHWARGFFANTVVAL